MNEQRKECTNSCKSLHDKMISRLDVRKPGIKAVDKLMCGN